MKDILRFPAREQDKRALSILAVDGGEGGIGQFGAGGGEVVRVGIARLKQAHRKVPLGKLSEGGSDAGCWSALLEKTVQLS
ncbi:hypothetical protein [Arthrobacter gengyunqii]|uniref:Uncharacterized protein n=1 Tax=Arthrobacter gengyunqii TaxID=2886940 RepID=A0ABS8GMJ2_9MICC|nr:hypothetical protein [Arthrobacter gengyunqii]MCC3267583.1 hypothetical protein [Arthrobacter gengyunqii]